jgi:hypothetical protein
LLAGTGIDDIRRLRHGRGAEADRGVQTACAAIPAGRRIIMPGPMTKFLALAPRRLPGPTVIPMLDWVRTRAG